MGTMTTTHALPTTTLLAAITIMVTGCVSPRFCFIPLAYYILAAGEPAPRLAQMEVWYQV
jgi:hypothetical protein